MNNSITLVFPSTLRKERNKELSELETHCGPQLP